MSAARVRTTLVSTLKDNSIWVLLLTALTVAAGILISEAQSKIGWRPLLLALAIVFSMFILVAFLVVAPLREQVGAALGSIERLVERQIAPNAITWLLNEEQLVAYERESKAPEVWLLTSDLLDDSHGGAFQGVVAENIRRGVKQTYFVPNMPEVRARVESILAFHNNHPNLGVVYLSDEFFFLSPRLDIVIYNPLGKGGIERTGFMGLPSPSGGWHFHAMVSGEFLDRLVGRLLPLISGADAVSGGESVKAAKPLPPPVTGSTVTRSS